MATVACDISVVNDTAEQSIKDIQDYTDAAMDGDFRGQIILVSKSQRIKMQFFLKNEMGENI